MKDTFLHKSLRRLTGFCAISLVAVWPMAAIPWSEDMTPVGAQRSGNLTGTIPSWTGGIEDKEFQVGENPFKDDKPRYVITGDNYHQYLDNLTEGHKALFRTFPGTYKMKVYPTRRSATYPNWFLSATKENAKRVTLNADGNSFCCTSKGYPFPIPQDGREIMWNHVMRYNTRGYNGYVNHVIVEKDGSFDVQRVYLELSYAYNNPNYDINRIAGRNLFALFTTLSPRHKAGDVILLHVPIDRINDRTMMWVFNRGRGRVQTVTQLGYDNPIYDSLMTHDQVDMFNGPLDRYNVALKGKYEIIVPYNSYKLYNPELKYKNIVSKGHINQNLARYEIHRVWVVEAMLRTGVTHRYRRRTFYLDEDTWLVLAQEMYDERGGLWRTSEAHAITLPNVPVVIAGEPGVQVHYDLQLQRYVLLNLTNEEARYIEYDWHKDAHHFTPQRLRDFGTGAY